MIPSKSDSEHSFFESPKIGDSASETGIQFEQSAIGFSELPKIITPTAASSEVLGLIPSPDAGLIGLQGIRSRWKKSDEQVEKSSKTVSIPNSQKQREKFRWVVIAIIIISALLSSFCSALSTVPGSKVALAVLVSTAAVNLGLEPVAMSIYTSEIQPNNRDAGILINWGNTVSEKNPAGAMAYYDEAMRLFPKAHSVYMNRSNNLRLLNRDKEALDGYNKAIELNPKYSLAYNNRAQYFVDKEKYAQALADFQKAIDFNGRFDNPSRNFYWFNRGHCYLQMNKWQLAIDDFDESVEHGFKDTWVYNNRAFALLNLHKYKESIADYTTSLQLDPSNEKAISGLAEAREKFQPDSTAQ